MCVCVYEYFAYISVAFFSSRIRYRMKFWQGIALYIFGWCGISAGCSNCIFAFTYSGTCCVFRSKRVIVWAWNGRVHCVVVDGFGVIAAVRELVF